MIRKEVFKWFERFKRGVISAEDHVCFERPLQILSKIRLHEL